MKSLKYIIGTLSILLYSCSSNTLIVGTYSGKSPHVFILSEDSTFKYEYHNYCYSESFGTWTKKEDAIYLNSFIQIDKIPLEFVKLGNNDNAIAVNIKVLSHDKPETDYICWPFINDEPCLFDPERGSFSFTSDIPIDNIYFKIRKSPFVLRGAGSKMCYNDVESEKINIKLSFGEDINIKINIIDSLFGYSVFKNEKLELRRGNLVFSENGVRNKLHLKK